jgi:hypothetical protein
VGDGGRTDELDTLVSCPTAIEESFAAPEQRRHNREMQVVDQSGPEILLDGGCTTSDPDISALSGIERFPECCLYTTIDEMECCAALHRDGRSWMMGEHKYWVVVRRVVSPPTCPGVGTPWSANWPKHVAAHDRGADAGITPRDECVIQAGIPAVLAKHPAPAPSREDPFMQPVTAHPERIVAALARTRCVAVE